MSDHATQIAAFTELADIVASVAVPPHVDFTHPLEPTAPFVYSAGFVPLVSSFKYAATSLYTYTVVMFLTICAVRLLTSDIEQALAHVCGLALVCVTVYGSSLLCRDCGGAWSLHATKSAITAVNLLVAVPVAFILTRSGGEEEDGWI